MFSISILIPTYNWNVLPLVRKIYDDLKEQDIKFEITVIDDASDSPLNKNNEKINELEHCNFSQLKSNIGRSSIRNLMAKRAQYDYVLFLDCDVMPKNNDFIKRYMLESHNYDVVIGGIAYKDGENNELLRWKIGRANEEKTVKERNLLAYKYILTGNLLVKKTVFLNIQFDESLTKYGYEDLLFARRIENTRIEVNHIDNTVYHLGIDENLLFLEKTKDALNNVVKLIKEGKLSYEDTRITNLYKKIDFLGGVKILELLLPFLKQRAFYNSSLLYYNLFRLGYLSKVIKDVK